MTEVLAALRTMRTIAQPDEFALQRTVAQALDHAGIHYQKEYVLAPRKRIDFLCQGGIGIEVKRGRPNAKQMRAQAQRYLQTDALTSLIVVVERTVDLPERICAKPVAVLGLNTLWGVAL